MLASLTSFAVLEGFIDTTVLPVTGTYTIAVDPNGSSVGATTLTRCPAVPANVTAPFWPGTVVVTVVGEPNAIVPLTSVGTSKSESVIDPVAELCGSMTIV